MLFQLVREQTRGRNILDLVITGNPDIIDQVSVEEPFGSSDYCRTDISLKLLLPRINASSRKIFLYSKADYREFDNEVQEIQWDNLLGNLKVNEMWNKIKSEYNRLVD